MTGMGKKESCKGWRLRWVQEQELLKGILEEKAQRVQGTPRFVSGPSGQLVMFNLIYGQDHFWKGSK